KLDAEGPVAHAGVLNKAKNPCDVKMGLKYGDFLADCVKTTGDMMSDTTEFNKLIGGIAHCTVRYFFDVVGFDVNFTAAELKPDDVVHDKDLPTATDVSTQFDVDQNLLGKIQNDLDPKTGQKDLHGTGYVYLEYARLVQEALSQYVSSTPRAIGA